MSVPISGLARTGKPRAIAARARRAEPRMVSDIVSGADSGAAAAAAATAKPLTRELDGIVHILTCGSVDDGKSTLIGRLLWDAGDLPDDQRDMVREASRKAGTPDKLDFSLLLDGLVAEREQGITIDIAWRYLDTHTRRFVIIDSPGHEQYTRNMASGASHADVAVMLIDARHGVKRQTRRHAAILNLMGVTRVVLAVNKMDLIDWSQVRFREIERDFRAAVAEFGFVDAAAIPVSARVGDNIAKPSGTMGWYRGQTLVEFLEAVPSRKAASGQAFRFPVQTVLRDGADFRGLAGTVSAGAVRVGDVVCDTSSGKQARVQRIATMDGDLGSATAGQAVALQLDTDIDVARGAVLASPKALPVKAHRLEARLVWLSDKSLDTDHGLLLRTATDLIPVATIEVKGRLDLDTMHLTDSPIFGANDIVVATISLARAAALDRFTDQHDTGGFVLVDPLSGGTLAAGIVVSASEEQRPARGGGFSLTYEVLARGLCSDLGTSPDNRLEFQRRAREVEILLRAAGVTVGTGDFAAVLFPETTAEFANGGPS